MSDKKMMVAEENIKLSLRDEATRTARQVGISFLQVSREPLKRLANAAIDELLAYLHDHIAA